MNQIMRLRRRATGDFEIKDSNNGYGHEKAFVNMIEKWGTLHEAQLLPRSFGDGSLVKGQTEPGAVKQLHREPADRGPRPQVRQGDARARRCSTPSCPTRSRCKRIFKEIESKDERLELNLYIVGEGDDEDARGRGRQRGMKLAYWPGCVSRGFTPELHGSMDAGRAEARHRAGRARPRQLLRRRRDRRAQPGARRHAQRAHVRAWPRASTAPRA